ncbi:hypothetical protein ACHAXR_007100 [Thalassiosira sp. AJA248-18]
MAELPTPHSIAIGTLISLYSDPNSPLLVLDWHNAENDGNDDTIVIGSGRGGGDDANGNERSTTEWSLQLMELIQRLVMKEDEGVVVLPNSKNYHDGELFNDVDDDRNPASDDDDDDDDDGTVRVADDHGTSTIDSIYGIDDILNNDDFFRKHALDGKDVLDDVLGLFGSRSGSGRGRSSPEMQSKVDKKKHDKQQLDGRRSFIGNINSDCTNAGSLNFCMEPLSTLLDRIDNAFLSRHQSPSPHRQRMQQQQQRTPPSLALLSRLQMASTSVDDLMNLLDEWHALLAGTHMGHPPPSKEKCNGMPPPVVPTTPISIDGESTFGVYLRRLCLGMEEIPFEALARLWDALRGFVGEEQRKMDSENEYSEHDNDVHYHGNTCNWLPSSPQIERIVRKTCLENNLDSLLLPRNHGNDNEERSIRPSSTTSSPHHNYHNLLATHPECPSLHFLLYLTALSAGRRSEALESLHRYFDYAMIHERKERAERTLLMLQAASGSGAGDHHGSEGFLASTTAASGMGGLTRMGSGMGGITGGMTGGIVNGAAVGGAAGQQLQRGAAGAAESASKMFRESNVMQYAAILLAQTYHRFGYARLSLQATEEAIRVAQQSGDEECVCFANGWLALVGSSVGTGSGGGGGGVGSRQSVHASVGGLVQGNYHGRNYRPLAAASNTTRISNASSPGEEEAMLHRCRARASERGLASLAAGASLELARRMAYRRHGFGDEEGGLGSSDEGAGTSSSLAWTSIQSAGRMLSATGTASAGHGRGGHGAAAMSGGAGGSGMVGQAPTDIYNMTNLEASSILGRQNIAIAGLWDSTGHSSLASLSSCAALYGSRSNTNVGGGDEMTSMSMERVLHSFANGPGLDVWTMDRQQRTRVSVGENHPHNAGENYAAILDKFVSLSQAPNSKNPEWISSASSSTLHEWSVRSYDLAMARGLHTLLANRAAFPSGSGGDGGGALSAVEASLVFLNQSTHLFCQVEQYDKAKASTRRACWLSSRHNLLFQHGWNLLQLALIDMEASTSSPSNSLSVERALPPLLECLSISERYSMDPLRAIAQTTLSKVLLCMGRYQKARAMLQAAMPLVMQQGHVWFQGEAFLTLAKCYLAEAQQPPQHGHEHDSTTSTRELYETALSELQKAAIHFTQIEDIHRLRQVYYIQARVCNSLPNARKERDEAAKQFVKLSVEKRERAVDSIMAMPPVVKGKKTSKKQWDVLQGVMITDSGELRRCVSMRRQR